MRKGWFKIPGVQEGDRHLEEQLVAVLPSLAEAAGASVLDIGTAEGLIAIEFARAGAVKVHGYDSVQGNVDVANQMKAREPEAISAVMDFRVLELTALVDRDLKFARDNRYDIVLALGIMHKLREPCIGIRYAGRVCGKLLLMRSQRGVRDGIVRSKFGYGSCDSHEMLKREGLVLDKIVAGPNHRQEDVEYWRRP